MSVTLPRLAAVCVLMGALHIKKCMLWGILNYGIHYMADVALHLVHIFMLCWFDRDLKLFISLEAIWLNTTGSVPHVDDWSMIYHRSGAMSSWKFWIFLNPACSVSKGETAGRDKKTTDGFWSDKVNGYHD